MAFIQNTTDKPSSGIRPREPFGAVEANRFKALILNQSADLLDALFDSAQHKLPDWDERDLDFDSPQPVRADEVLRFLQQERIIISCCFIEEFGHALSHGSTSDGGLFTPAEFTGAAAKFPEDEAPLDRRISIMARKADFRYCDIMTRCLTQLDLAIGDNKSLELTPEGMAPAHACNAFRLALLAANTPDEIEDRLFKLFEHEVLAGLGKCYAVLSAHMDTLGYRAPSGAGDRNWNTETDPEKASREGAVANPDINPPAIKPPAGTTSADADLVTRFLEGLVGDLRDDLGVSAVTRSLLNRFYAPALQCALKDGDILGNVDHPVRRLYCELALIDMLAAPAAKQAHRVASKILESLGPTPNTTQVAESLRDLETALAQDSGSQDQPERAARRATLELMQQASGLNMSQETRSFLTDCWVPLLETAARKGATSEDFLSVRNHGQAIMDTLRRIKVGGNGAAEQREEMLKSTERKLKIFGVPQDRQEEIANRLKRLCEVNTADGGNAPYCEQEADLLDELAAWRPVTETVNDETTTDEIALDKDALTLLDRLCKPDVWFRIYAGPNSSARWRKLTAYDRDNQMIYFGDRNGENGLAVSAAEFALDLMEGRSRPVYDSEEFSKNLTGIIHSQSRKLDDTET